MSRAELICMLAKECQGQVYGAQSSVLDRSLGSLLFVASEGTVCEYTAARNHGTLSRRFPLQTSNKCFPRVSLAE